MDSRSTLRTAAVLVGGFAILCAVVVGWGWLLTHPLATSIGVGDNRLSRHVAEARTPTLDRVADVGTFIGETWLGGVVLVLMGAAFSWWQRAWRPLVFVVVTYGALGVLYVVATHVDTRQRPPVKILDPGLIQDHSFPSGHTATTTAIVGCLIALTATYAPHALRWVVPLVVLPVLTLLSRLYQGAHHLSDVLTSLTYATVLVVFTSRLLLAPARRRSRASRRA
jgi:membrane-associated phospholipid phosphatase